MQQGGNSQGVWWGGTQKDKGELQVLLTVGTVLWDFKKQCKEPMGAGRNAGVTAEGERKSEHTSIGNQSLLVLLFPLTNELKP